MDLSESLIEEYLEKHSGANTAQNLFDPNFPEQTAFIKDPSRLKALFCTRRAAKSYTSGLYLVKECLENPGVNCLFIGLTRDSAKGIIWKDILKPINRINGLGGVFNETALTVTFPNGSVIWVTGIDADADEMQKLLGRKYRLVIVDEASMYSVDLRMLIYGILKPAVADERGTICMAGTASNIASGLFYDITTGVEPGWKLFQWTAHDNPHVAKQWQEELDEIDRTRPLFKETALYRQWFCNEWVVDEEALIYKYDELRNKTAGLPADLSGWHFVLGVDLGHSPDPTAFVVGAYHDLSPLLCLVYAYKKTHMDITDVATFIKDLERRFPFEVKVVDGSAKQAVAELNNRHGLSLIPADKAGKVDFINLMNGDLIQGLIKLLPAASPLAEEYKKLVWDSDSSGKIKEPRKEHPGSDNHLTDAALYLWRYCHQYLFKAPLPFLDKSKQEVWERAHIEKLELEVRKKQNPNELELDWPGEWDEDYGADTL